MCGIWGVFPRGNKGFFPSDTGIIKQMMILTSLRGDDSTGFAMLESPEKKPKITKGLGGPAYILNSDAWDKLEEFMIKKAKLVFGHGRAATKGLVSPKNAHPFVHNHITLVHNGTINTGLDEEHKEVETEVDSHALCVAIANKGLVEALKPIYGAYAIIAHDSKERKIYVVRNDQRPLHQLVLTDKIIIMSEFDGLAYLAKRNGNHSPKIEYFPPHVIFEYDIDADKWTSNTELKEYHEKKWKPTTATWSQSTPIGGQGSSTGYGVGSSSNFKDTQRYEVVELLCTKVEETANKSSFKYVFADEEGQEYSAVSSYHEKEREGSLARIKSYTKIENKSTGNITRFVKFREIEWWNETKKDFDPPRLDLVIVQTAPASDDGIVEDLDAPVQTFNRRMIKKSRWLELIKKEDCCICRSDIREHEVENTYLTGSDTLICADCIVKGKHYSYGYGQ